MSSMCTKASGSRRLAGVAMGVVDRHLPDTRGKVTGNLPERRLDAEQDVGDRGARHDARMPRVHDRVGVSENRFDRERPAGENHDDHRLAGALDGADQVHLVAGQVDVGARVRFAGKNRFLAEEQHRRVRAAGRGHGIGECSGRSAARRLHRAHVTDRDVRTRDFPDRLQRRPAERRIAVEDPGAELLVRVVGHRPDHRERAQRLHARAAARALRFCSSTRLCVVSFRASARFCALATAGNAAGSVTVRSNSPSRNFTRSTLRTAASSVRLVDALLGQQRRQVIAVGRARHLHVDAGAQRLERGVLLAGGEAMHDHVDDRFPVADDEARELPFVPQHGPQQETVARCGDAVDVAEGGHEGGDARIDRRLEGRHVDVAQVDLGDADVAVVTPAFARAVADEMLGASRDRARPGQVVALEAADRRDAEHRRRGTDPRRSSRRCAPSADRATRRSSARTSSSRPDAAASSAAMRAPCCTRSGFQAAAWPSGIGSTVLKPWMTSRPISRGMPRRLSCTAMRCSSLTVATSTALSTEPTLPALTAARSLSEILPSSAFTCVSWPIFSADRHLAEQPFDAFVDRSATRLGARGRVHACQQGHRAQERPSAPAENGSHRHDFALQ